MVVGGARRATEAVSGAINRHVPMSAQVACGLALGSLGGYLDATRPGPSGIGLAGALLALQVLDHEGVVSLPWNRYMPAVPVHGGHRRSAPPARGTTRAELARVEAEAFIRNNAFLVGSFAGAFFLTRYLSSRD